jgi:hypothetical protein
MERLTTWNGSKYTLPQGRTADGESNWRKIADRLAELEDNMPEHDEMRYGFSDIMMPIDNKRIERFARIWNRDCEAIVTRWLNEPEWALTFEASKGDSWWIKAQAEQATAFFFMEMLSDAECVSPSYIYNMLKAEVEKRKAVRK